MKIEIWSDYACPYCYIGKKQLEKALDALDMKDAVEIVFKSFELDPNAPLQYNENIYEIISKKYGISLEQSKAANQQIAIMGKQVGIEYNFDDLKPGNTFDAHRLAHYAMAEGKMTEYSEAVLRAYFVESQRISNKEVLGQIAEAVGLNADEALKVLSSEAYKDAVRNDEAEARQLNVTSVPFFVIDRKLAVSGAQPAENFIEAIKEAQKS